MSGRWETVRQSRDRHRRGVGIGKATVELFRSEGATVVGADVSEGADCAPTRAAKTHVRDLVDEAASEHGGLDIVFANAGISGGFATMPNRQPPTGPRSCAST